MAVSYNKLYKVLEDKNVTMVELRKAADIAPNTMTRIRKNEEVSLDVLGRICHVLTSFITEKVNPQLGYVTADFACGTGGFLIDAVEHLRKQVTKAEDNETIEKTVFGVEKKQFPYMLYL